LLNPLRHDLHELDRDIEVQEIHIVVLQTVLEKAPGPDGYIGAFFKACWDIIKHDLVGAISEIFDLRAGCWNLPNSANIVLIEKKEGAQYIGDYRPISIMHSISKLLAKIFANRLSPHLDSLISRSRSVFIKGRSIQDNFQYVQGAVNHFYQSKTPVLLLKLDITKAFDSVRWKSWNK
jgi:retron-type reverse transcriptase